MGTAPAPDDRSQMSVGVRLGRLALAAVAAVLTVNLYTGAPLLAIWTGAHVQGGISLTMGAVGTVLGVLVVTVAILVFLLVRVEALYKGLSGQPVDRRTPPWLRSLRDERPELSEKRGLDAIEKIMIAAVVLAVGGMEVWFFFFAGSSIATS